MKVIRIIQTDSFNTPSDVALIDMECEFCRHEEGGVWCIKSNISNSKLITWKCRYCGKYSKTKNKQ